MSKREPGLITELIPPGKYDCELTFDKHNREVYRILSGRYAGRIIFGKRHPHIVDIYVDVKSKIQSKEIVAWNTGNLA